MKGKNVVFGLIIFVIIAMIFTWFFLNQSIIQLDKL